MPMATISTNVTTKVTAESTAAKHEELTKLVNTTSNGGSKGGEVEQAKTCQPSQLENNSKSNSSMPLTSDQPQEVPPTMSSDNCVIMHQSPLNKINVIPGDSKNSPNDHVNDYHFTSPTFV